MARYSFKLHDGHHAIAPETVDLPDMAAARREGLRRAGVALVIDAHAFRPSDDWRLDVTDDAGTLLYSFDVAMSVAPAARR